MNGEEIHNRLKLVRDFATAVIKSYRATNEPVRFSEAKAQQDERNAEKLLKELLGRQPTPQETDEALS